MEYESLEPDLLSDPNYTPERLFADLHEHFKSDTQVRIAEALRVPPAVISRQKRKKMAMSGNMLIRIHEVTNWPISFIKLRLGMTKGGEKCSSTPQS